MLKKITYHIISLLIIALFSSFAYAASDVVNPIQYNTISSLFQGAMNYFMTIAGAVAIIFLIIGGLMYMTSGGNKAVMERAKNTLVYAVVGIVIVMAAPLFLSDILNVLRGKGGTGSSGLLRVATNVLQVLLSMIGILGILGLINAAVIMFISAGYEESMKGARKSLSYALIGIALSFGSLVLIRAVEGTLDPGFKAFKIQ